MKAKIADIKRFAVHDGDGIRTVVFFKGCPLKCRWCHNPETIDPKPQIAFYADKCIGCGECMEVCPVGARSAQGFDRGLCIGCGKCAEVCLGDALKHYGREVTVEELLPILTQDRSFYETSGGGVTLSGGECLQQADFCLELLKRLKKEGIHTAVDTCGFVSNTVLQKIIPYTDLFLYDLKAADPQVHKTCTGQENGVILENLKYLDQAGKRTEIRIPYVPGWNDGELESIRQLARPLKNVSAVRVLPYHNYAGSKYKALNMENTLPHKLPAQDEIQRAEALFK